MRGFSLVELSIVLVILGLLTGGILAGQSLIRASELRATASEYQRYMTASQTFRDKYFALPGDFRDATRFWTRQVAVASCVTNSGAAGPNANGSCDGDGNGRVEVLGGAGLSGEMLQFWRQLALAGLIEGSYSGLSGTTINDVTLGTSAPTSKLGNAGWTAGWSPPFAGDGVNYAMDYGNFFQYGAKVASSTTWGPALKPEEAWNIDTKLDDGKPAYGKVVTHYWNNLCSVADDGGSANNDLAASYKLTDTSLQCDLVFRQIF